MERLDTGPLGFTKISRLANDDDGMETINKKKRKIRAADRGISEIDLPPRIDRILNILLEIYLLVLDAQREWSYYPTVLYSMVWCCVDRPYTQLERYCGVWCVGWTA
jgi:hypothetical protein